MDGAVLMILLMMNLTAKIKFFERGPPERPNIFSSIQEYAEKHPGRLTARLLKKMKGILAREEGPENHMAKPDPSSRRIVLSGSSDPSVSGSTEPEDESGAEVHLQSSGSTRPGPWSSDLGPGPVPAGADPSGRGIAGGEGAHGVKGAGDRQPSVEGTGKGEGKRRCRDMGAAQEA